MTGTQERRAKYRRFSDRRINLLLRLHEILFDMEVGPQRDAALIDAVRDDFESDRAMLVARGKDGQHGVEVAAVVGFNDCELTGTRLDGKGLEDLLNVHRLASGAITLTYTRRPSAFSTEGWERLWTGDLGAETAALLSVPVETARADRHLLWLQQAAHSREWSSQDRELAEEIAGLLARAADKALEGK